MAGAGVPMPLELVRAGITPRELDVLRCLVARLSNREIADQLVVSVRTVESHVSALLTKLGVATRRELAGRGAALLEQPSAAGGGGLPVALNRLIGRAQELADVTALLSSGRLVTLTGPAGMGKTRLAIEIGRAAGERYTGGVRVVDLAPARHGYEVADRLLAALGVAQVPGQPAVDTLAKAGSERSVLLVVDNCEHVLAACARLVETLLGHWPVVQVLATSRAPLGVPGERVYQLRPLAVPDEQTGELPDVLAAEAVQLLADRAEAAGAGLSITSTNAAAVALLCRRLDGLPLAVELLAPRLRTFTPDQLLARLDDRLSLLTSGGPGVQPRHRTLRRAIDWSFETLSEPERSLFTALAVFPGSFSFEAAEAICTQPSDAPSVVEMLPVLVDRSLVVTVPAGATNRYRLLETLRDYARERLDAAAEQALAERHAAHFVEFAEQAESGLRGARAPEWLDRLRAEQDNLDAALQWTSDHQPADTLRLVAALDRFWEDANQRRSGIDWAERALAASTDRSALRLRALLAAAKLVAPSDVIRLQEVAAEVTQLAEGLADDRWLAHAKLCRAAAQGYATSPTEVDIESTEEAIDYFRTVGDRWQTAGALQTLSLLQAPESALHSLGEARRLYAKEGDRLSAANCAFMMSSVLVRDLGNPAPAQQLAREALDAFGELGHQHEQAHARSILAEIDYRTSKPQRAVEAARSCLQTFRRAADHRCESAMLLLLAAVEADCGDDRAAMQLLRDTIEVALQGAHARTLPQAFSRLARLVAGHDPLVAVSLFAASDSRRESPLAATEGSAAELAALRKDVPPAAFEAAWERGARASIDDVLAIVDEAMAQAGLR